MRQNRQYPHGWDEARVRRVLEHYDHQDDLGAVAEDEAALVDTSQTVVEIPNELVPEVRVLLSRHIDKREPDERKSGGTERPAGP
jgi:hypothetical protein